MDKSGVTPNTISLPEGPGAIEGLGESFEPTLNTGTAKYAIALTVPPGTAGHTPQLVLRYDGGSGNGPLGPGWSMDFPFIQRQTDKGIPRYIDDGNDRDDDGDGEVDETDEIDVFINELKEELVPVAQNSGGSDQGAGTEVINYFSENEGAFVRYRRIGEHWEGRLPDGTLLEFGVTANARITDEAGMKIFRWLLERQTDTNGNTIIYSYREFPKQEELGANPTNAELLREKHQNLNQKYCSLVEYGPGIPTGSQTPRWDNYHFVVFEYEDRSDWFEDCRPGFQVRTGKRLNNIIIGTAGPDLANHNKVNFPKLEIENANLNREYLLDYHPGHWSLLNSVTPVGADGVSVANSEGKDIHNLLPPTTFGYTICNPAATISATSAIIGSQNTPTQVIDKAWIDLVDLNGDGLPDMLKTDPQGGVNTAYLNEGEIVNGDSPVIKWGAGIDVQGDQRTWNVNLAETFGAIAHLADMDADGLADLVYTAGEDTYYFPNEASSTTPTWGTRLQMNRDEEISMPPSPFAVEHVKTADLDFDKRIDIIQSISVAGEASYRVWCNLGDQRFAKSVTVNHQTGFMLSDPGVHIADINGDRVPDIARVRPSGLEVITGLGYGNFMPITKMLIPDRTLETDEVETAVFQDVSGDGLADLVIERAAPGQLWLWINLGNYTYSERHVITGMPTTLTTEPEVRWADINGNGTTDLVYADPQAEPRLQSIDIGRILGCDPAPHLLIHIDNGIGAKTTVTYGTTTEFALADANNGSPWPDPLPFPFHVVTQVTVDDSLGKNYVTKFNYHDGYYDPNEREFRGFGRVEVTNIGDSTAPTLVTRSEFDTGKTIEAMKGKLLRIAAESETNAVFWDETTSWATRTLDTGSDGKDINFAFPDSRIRDIIELSQGESKRIEFEFEYDDYGNETANKEYGIVEEDNRSVGNDERITTTEYALNLDDWLVRFPSRKEISDLSGKIISREETYYDDPNFGATNFGVVTKGNPTLARNWIDPLDPSATTDTVRTKYDEFGNPIEILDPLASGTDSDGHYRSLVYDSEFKTYPVSETIHIGENSGDLVIQADYDVGFGTVTSSTDFNGHETTYGYDRFARLINIVRPGDSNDLPTVEYDYVLADAFTAGKLINHVETRQLDKDTKSVGDPTNVGGDVPVGDPAPNKLDFYLITRHFIDGLGREVMTKEEAEPDEDGNPRVVVKNAVLFNARKEKATMLNPYYSLSGSGTLESLLAFEDITADGWKGGIFHQDGDDVTRGFDQAHKIEIEYDATLRPIRTINPDGSEQQKVYEPLLTKSYDENDTNSESDYRDTPMVHYNDGLERLVQVDEMVRLNDDGTSASDLKTWTTTYQYRADDVLTRIIDSQDNEKWMEYDGLGRKTFMNDPDRGTMDYFYDKASNLIRTIDAKDQQIDYTYDGVNRLLTEDYPDTEERSGLDVIYHYDKPAGEIDMGNGSQETAQNTKGFLSYVKDLSGEEHTSYDKRGRVTWEVKRIRDPVNGNLASYKTEMAYDSMDRVVSLIYPDEDRCEYKYNARGMLERITGGASANVNNTPFIIENIDYTPSGQTLATLFGNSVTSTFGYDNRTRLKQSTSVSGQNPPLIDYGYTFDAASNITRIDDNRPGTIRPEGDPRRNTQIFTYDDLYRITSVQYSFNLPGDAIRDDGSINYRYDRIGNMLAKSSGIDHTEKELSVTNLGDMGYGDTAGTWGRIGRNAGDPPGPHALTSISNLKSQIQNRIYPYDENGNMTNIDGLECTWDAKDRLIKVENDEMRAEYTYDYTDRRITKKVTPKATDSNLPNDNCPLTTSYINKFFEVREGDQPTKYVFNGDTRVARITGTLDSSRERVQRFRLAAGWNLLSLAVDAEDAETQLGIGDDMNIQSAYIWNPVSNQYDPLRLESESEAESESIMPEPKLELGSVFWLIVENPVTLEVFGTYTPLDPENSPSIPSGTNFSVNPTLEALFTDSALPPGIRSTAVFDPNTQSWQFRFTETADFLSNFPSFIRPGHPIITETDTPSNLVLRPSSFAIAYYHKDHLGSSNIIADGNGTVIDETVFYPFGHPRHHHRPQPATSIMSAKYEFTQKERDSENGLQYFEARYLAGHLGRFVSFDPNRITVVISSIKNPLNLNPYNYTKSNPLRFIDPLGTDDVDTFDDVMVRTETELKNTNEQINALRRKISLLNLKRRALEGKFNRAKAAEISNEAVKNSNKDIKKLQGPGDLAKNVISLRPPKDLKDLLKPASPLGILQGLLEPISTGIKLYGRGKSVLSAEDRENAFFDQILSKEKELKTAKNQLSNTLKIQKGLQEKLFKLKFLNIFRSSEGK